MPTPTHLSSGNHQSAIASEPNVTAFIERWKEKGGTEKANYQLFLTELCELLGLDKPDPASETNSENAYVFERLVHINKPDGSSTHGFIDLYKRGCFVLEAKQTGKSLGSDGWDKAMLKAQTQADQYVRALPVAEEGRPPFIVVTDVGRSLELYSEFTRSGGTYVPYPDPGHHRIRIEDLHQTHIQHRLYNLWQNPDALDTSKQAAQVTREVSSKLAELAKSLEQSGYEVDRVAHFLKRCLFTMFAEDVELLPLQSFTRLLERLQENPEHFPDAMRSLWQTMNTGGYEGQLMHKLQRFNGGLFKDIDPIPLNAKQIALLVEAAHADWRFVEPAIFGTLLERALDPRERHKLGAHYTPRAYVERLVMPTLIDPLREEWQSVQVAVEAWLQQDKHKQALKELHTFHQKLCNTRVLDPACGSGNFLYVALEHMKRLEGEVLNLMRDLSAGQSSFETEGLSVDPHQFLGIEINPRAAAIAEIVLWIGYLQWHYRINGKLDLPEPILKDFHNIECRDALITYDAREIIKDENGNDKTIWDGISFKPSPVTGELIPDDSQRIPIYHYINPQAAQWPEADYIVGNPPFIGKSRIREALGDGYVNALRTAYKGKVPESVDFVMYWWFMASELITTGQLKNAGLITTNSFKQLFNRKLVDKYLYSKTPLSLIYAISDHPWVDSSDGASVRISMTVISKGDSLGKLFSKPIGRNQSSDSLGDFSVGKIHSDLKIGADLVNSSKILSNSRLCSVGVMVHGAGLILDEDQKTLFISKEKSSVVKHIRPYLNGKDIVQTTRNKFVLDFFGISDLELKELYPFSYQWLFEKVKPARDQKKDKSSREKWWLLARPRNEWRKISESLSVYAATPRISKHRIFIQLEKDVLPDDKVVNIGLSTGYSLGVLSSRLHIRWAISTGSFLGVGNDSCYNYSDCFEKFPFPELTEKQKNHIAELAEQIDKHRKQQQAKHEKLTLTGMYNVLEKVRKGEALDEKEKQIHEQGLVSILQELHDELDKAVFAAYGWSDLGDVLVGKPGATTPLTDKSAEQAEAEEELLCRLVDLNQQRAAEEAQGHVRWLRPEFQAPEATQTSADVNVLTSKKADTIASTIKQSWPKNMPEQVNAVRELLASGPQTLDTLSAQFKNKPSKSLAQVLGALEVLGQANLQGDTWYLGGV